MSDTREQSEPVAPVYGGRWVGHARGVAFFFAAVFLLNLMAQFRLAEFDYDPNHWWLSFRPLPKVLEQFALICVVVFFVAYAVAPVTSAWRRRGTRMAVELLWVLAAWNVINYYGALFRGVFRTSFPVPFALFVAAALLVVWVAAGVERPPRGVRQGLLAAVAVAVAAVVFPLLQIVTFGLLDHRGTTAPALSAVVVFTDGAAGSAGVAGRLKSVAELYRRGGVIEVFAPDAGRELRTALVAVGVPAENVELGSPEERADPWRDAIREASRMFPKDQLRVYAVAGFDELPRIDALFAQEGRTAFPVPVVHGSGATAGTVLGEVGRLWKCYFSAVVH